jgi:hypothetical protein
MRNSLSPESRSPIRLKPTTFSALNDMYLNKTIDFSPKLTPRNSKLPPLNTCVRSFYRLTDRPSPLYSTYYKRQIIGTRGIKKRSQMDKHIRAMSQIHEIGTDGNSNKTHSLPKRNSTNQLDKQYATLPTLAVGSVSAPINRISKLGGFSIVTEDLYQSDIIQNTPNTQDSTKPSSSGTRRTRRNNHTGSLFTGISTAKSVSLKSTAKFQEQNVVISIIAPSIFIKSPTREFTHSFQINEISKLFWAKTSYNSSFLSFLLSRSSFISEEINEVKNTVFKINVSNLDTRDDSIYGMGVENEVAKLDGETFECIFRMPYVEMFNPTTQESFFRDLTYRHMVDLQSGYYDSWEKIAKDCF